MSNSAWAHGSTPTLASKIDTLTIQTAQLLGSGYRPTAWCVNQGCHIPLPVGTAICPECGARQQRACDCTDGHRQQPLENCPRCQGTGALH